MRWSDIPRDPPARLLRQFAGLWLAFFLGLATWQGLVRGRSTLALCAVLAASVGGLGLARPRALRPPVVGWTRPAVPIGLVLSHVAPAGICYGLSPPLALVFRT